VLLFSESQIKPGCYRFGPAHLRSFNNGCTVLLVCMYDKWCTEIFTRLFGLDAKVATRIETFAALYALS